MQVQVQVVTSPGGEVYPGLEGEEGEGEHQLGRQDGVHLARIDVLHSILPFSIDQLLSNTQ